MTSIWIHLSAFWSVAVMNCIQPVNWQYCLPIHEWLLPELRQGIEIMLDDEMNFLYENERDHLDSSVNTDVL